MNFPRPVSASVKFIERHEQLAVGILLALFVGFNVLTAPYSPDPWGDEVCYSDPGVTLGTEGHLASTAWGDRGVPVWTGNMPLHQLLLGGFIRIFGFSCRTVRSVNVFYYALAVFLVYRIVRRHDLIRRPEFRLLLVAVLLSGTGLVALYRNGRYDTIGTLLVTFWIWCSLQTRQKPVLLIGTFLAAILMPVASLNIAPLLVLCGLTALCLWRWKSIPALLVTGAGCLAGMAAMQLAYAHFGVPHIFREAMKSAGGKDVVSDYIQSVFENPSYVVAVAAAAGLLVFSLKRGGMRDDSRRKTAALALLGLAIVVPQFMEVVAKYHIYYTWMAIIPATVCAFMVFEFEFVPNPARIAAIILIVAATLPGLPRRCLRIAGSWMRDRPGLIASAALKDVSRSDVIYVDGQCVAVYYALRPFVHQGFWADPPADAKDKAALTVVFWPEPGGEKDLHDLLGGEWRQTDYQVIGSQKLQLISEPPVRLAVYRKN